MINFDTPLGTPVDQLERDSLQSILHQRRDLPRVRSWHFCDRVRLSHYERRLDLANVVIDFSFDRRTALSRQSGIVGGEREGDEPNDEKVCLGGLVTEQGSSNEIVVECWYSLPRMNGSESLERRLVANVEEERFSQIELRSRTHLVSYGHRDRNGEEDEPWVQSRPWRLACGSN